MSDEDSISLPDIDVKNAPKDKVIESDDNDNDSVHEILKSIGKKQNEPDPTTSDEEEVEANSKDAEQSDTSTKITTPKSKNGSILKSPARKSAEKKVSKIVYKSEISSSEEEAEKGSEDEEFIPDELPGRKQRARPRVTRTSPKRNRPGPASRTLSKKTPSKVDSDEDDSEEEVKSKNKKGKSVPTRSGSAKSKTRSRDDKSNSESESSEEDKKKKKVISSSTKVNNVSSGKSKLRGRAKIDSDESEVEQKVNKKVSSSKSSNAKSEKTKSRKRKSSSDSEEDEQSEEEVKGKSQNKKSNVVSSGKSSGKSKSSDDEDEEKNKPASTGKANKNEKAKPISKANVEDSDSDSDVEEEYVVDKILDKKVEKKVVLYYLSWRGFDSSHNSWEPKKNIYCDDLIEEFEAKLKAKNSPKPKPKSAATVSSAVSNYRAGPASKTKKRPMKTLSPSPNKAKRIKNDSSTTDEEDSDNNADLKKGKEKPTIEPEDKVLPCTCLHCSKKFDFKKTKKWTLSTLLNGTLNLNVYEGLNMFYTHYKGAYPLSKLEPIATKTEETRQLCASCAQLVEKFCSALRELTFASNSKSTCSEIIGDLEEEKADWSGLLESENDDVPVERSRASRAGAEKVSYKEVEED